jgi:hypothetical protein
MLTLRIRQPCSDHLGLCRLALGSLDDVFQCAGNKKRDFSRRGSSGNWAEDQLTWKVRKVCTVLHLHSV